MKMQNCKLCVLVFVVTATAGCAFTSQIPENTLLTVGEPHMLDVSLQSGNGLIVFEDSFTDKRQSFAGFVLHDEDAEGIYAWYTQLEPSFGEQHWLHSDQSVIDSRISMELRLRSTEHDVTISSRRDRSSEDGVYVRIHENQLALSEHSNGSSRQLAQYELEDDANEWMRLEFEVIADRARVLIDQQEVAVSEVSHHMAGESVLEHTSLSDVASIRVYHLPFPSPQVQTRGSILTVHTLADAFDGEALHQYWRGVGDVRLSSRPDSSGLMVYGSDDFMQYLGVETIPVFPGQGYVEFYGRPPRWSEAATVLICRGAISESWGIRLYPDRAQVIENHQGGGIIHAEVRLDTDVWNTVGLNQIRIAVEDGKIYLSVNETPILKSAPLSYSPHGLSGQIFLGYSGVIDSSRIFVIRDVHIQDSLPDTFSAESFPAGAPFVRNRTLAQDVLPPYESPHNGVIDTFNRRSDGRWRAYYNRASRGSKDIVYDNESDTGYMRLRFDMQDGDGLHAQISRTQRRDLSEFGGISFRARAFGTRQAHISLLDNLGHLHGTAIPVNNRINAHFAVDTEWQEYFIPFSLNYFQPYRRQLAEGATGNFDFRRVDTILFEVWGYHGEGELHIDDVRLLPAGAAERLTSRMVMENFEESQQTVSVLNPSTRRGIGGAISYNFTDGGGALGTDRFMRLEATRHNDGFATLDFSGTIIGSGFEGAGFSIRSEDLPAYRFRLSELEPGFSNHGHYFTSSWESLIPVNTTWVEWRMPFHSAALRTASEIISPLSSGILHGDMIDSIGFAFPHELSGRNQIVDIDELMLYQKGIDQEPVVGLFFPVHTGQDPNRQFENIIHTAMDYNLRRVEEYTVVSDLRARSVSSAVAEAGMNNVDFFLMPTYSISDRLLLLDVEVFSATAQTVLHRVRSNAAVGIDIFRELDQLSVNIINLIAETDLVFLDSVEKQSDDSLIWRDPMDLLQEYWLTYTDMSEFLPHNEMILSQAYVNDIESISFRIEDSDSETIDLYWNFRSLSSYNRLTVYPDRLAVTINNTTEQIFDIPSGEDHPWQLEVLPAAENTCEIRLNGVLLGIAHGPDLAFGRVGFGRGVESARDLEVVYSD